MTTRFGNKVYPHSDQMDTNTAEIILAAQQFTPWFTSYQHFAVFNHPGYTINEIFPSVKHITTFIRFSRPGEKSNTSGIESFRCQQLCCDKIFFFYFLRPTSHKSLSYLIKIDIYIFLVCLYSIFSILCINYQK